MYFMWTMVIDVLDLLYLPIYITFYSFITTYLFFLNSFFSLVFYFYCMILAVIHVFFCGYPKNYMIHIYH